MAPAGDDFQQLAGLTVLVVDDEEKVRAGTRAVLGLYGVQVEMADGLGSALAAARQLGDRLDMLIVDFRLRDHEDGIQVVAQVRALLGKPLPAILVTGDTAPERVRQAEQSGLPVLYKPVGSRQLARAIRQNTDSGSRPSNRTTSAAPIGR
jgi:CheY-like chemotaxis protein